MVMAVSQVRFGKNPNPQWKKRGGQIFLMPLQNWGGASWSTSIRMRAFPSIPRIFEIQFGIKMTARRVQPAMRWLKLTDGHTSGVENTCSLNHRGSIVK